MSSVVVIRIITQAVKTSVAIRTIQKCLLQKRNMIDPLILTEHTNMR